MILIVKLQKALRFKMRLSINGPRFTCASGEFGWSLMSIVEMVQRNAVTKDMILSISRASLEAKTYNRVRW